MADRKPIPDIMGGLLEGKKAQQPPAGEQPAQPAGEPAERPATSKPSKQQASKPAKRNTSKPVKQQASKEAEEPAAGDKLKATFYLSPEATDALEEIWIRLRRQARPERRKQISKSGIVEAALLLALEDLEEQGAESQIASKLAGQ